MDIKKTAISFVKILTAFIIFDAITLVPMFLLQEMGFDEILIFILPIVSSVILFISSYLLKIRICKETYIAYFLMLCLNIAVSMININHESFLTLLFFNTQIILRNVYTFVDESKIYIIYILAVAAPLLQVLISFLAATLKSKKLKNS